MVYHENADLDALIEAAPLGIVVFDSQAVITRWNPAAEKIFGWKENEVVGKAYNPVLPDGDDEIYRQMRENLLSGGSLKGEEVIRKRKDGVYINVKAHSSLLKDKSGKVTGVIGMYEDVTEQKREHGLLVWNELLLRLMTESSGSGYYLVDNRSDKILYCNNRFAEIWELDGPESIKNISNSQVINLCANKVKYKNNFLSSFGVLKDFNNQSVYEDEIQLSDSRSLKYYTTPLKDSNSNYLGRFFVFDDITESKLYEALLKSEKEYIEQVEKSGEATAVTDSNGKVIIFNNSAEKLTGIKRKAAEGNRLHSILGTEDFINTSGLSFGKTVTYIKEFKDSNYEFHVRLHSVDKIQITIFSAGKKERQGKNNFSQMQAKFIFTAEEMKKVNYEISRLANIDFDVLIEGETGVGKDLAASQIHMRSSRKNHPFIPVSISSLNESLIESELFGHEKGAYSGADKQMIGKFEAADKGVLYIPEVSALPEKIQLKLLHFMQYKSITRVGQDGRRGEINLDVRLIMATNENIEELVRSGKIRKDFYYRISGTKLVIPPLRERREDIKPIAEYYLQKFSESFPGKKFEISEASFKLLHEYPWHGNVRELVSCIKNVISFNTGYYIEPENFRNLLKLNADKEISHVTAISTEITGLEQAENEFKKNYFKILLEKTNYKIAEAAKLAGMTPQGLRKALNKLGL